MRNALKEWNCIIEALGNGEIAAIWRKGGIEDNPSIKAPFETFKLEKDQFILFPTSTHQNQNKIKEAYWSRLAENAGPNKDNQVKVKYWAEVEEEIELESINQLLNVSNELVNSDEHLVSSWNLYPDHKGKILILRVYKLTNLILIPYSPDYSGCKSWIDLKIEIPKIGSKPILSFKEFSQKVRLIQALISEKEIIEKVPA